MKNEMSYEDMRKQSFHTFITNIFVSVMIAIVIIFNFDLLAGIIVLFLSMIMLELQDVVIMLTRILYGNKKKHKPLY